MINQKSNIADPVQILAAYLEANQSGCRTLRRRAVIHYSNSKLTLLICTVEVITSDIEPVEAVASRYYPQALLFEDRLSDRELLEFVKQVGEGRFCLAEHLLEATNTDRQWTGSWVPRRNDYMLRAGHVLSAQFDVVNAYLYEPLQAPQQPYYPDLFEAAKDWLSFPVYHGSSDGRKGEIILLLPETRAYLADATRNGKTFDIRVAGTELNKLLLELKGAWWDEKGIHHFEEKVSNGLAQLNIPATAKRLEYVLVDSEGTEYDHHYMMQIEPQSSEQTTHSIKDIKDERGCRLLIRENWLAIKKQYGEDADGHQVLRVLEKNKAKGEKLYALKTVQNTLIKLRREKLIP